MLGLRHDRDVIDWIGGKSETIDGNNPWATAFREMEEELANFTASLSLSRDTRKIEFVNPLTNLTIVVYKIPLCSLDFETIRLRVAKDVHEWPAGELRQPLDYSVAVGKTFADIGIVSVAELTRSVQASSSVDDVLAKEWMMVRHVKWTNLRTNVPRWLPLRAFASIVFSNILSLSNTE